MKNEFVLKVVAESTNLPQFSVFHFLTPMCFCLSISALSFGLLAFIIKNNSKKYQTPFLL